MKIETAVGSILLLGLSSVAAQYEPVWPDTQPEIVSAIMSRTSMTVRSIEKSLVLYRDILGLTPFYEREKLTDARLVDFSGLSPTQTMRLVVLRTETDAAAKLNAGYLGLAEIHDADGSLAVLPESTQSAATYGSTALLFVVEDTALVHRLVVAAGFEVISAPKTQPDGSQTQLLMRGPDGERLWITQSDMRTPFIQQR